MPAALALAVTRKVNGNRVDPLDNALDLCRPEIA
jgi:hypothetical protein